MSEVCFSSIPHIDDMYRNISMLGVAAAEDDVVKMYKLIKNGCDINHNKTVYQIYFDDDDNGTWAGGVTPLHIASSEGSSGEICTVVLFKSSSPVCSFLYNH